METDKLRELQANDDTPMTFKDASSNAGEICFDLGFTGNIIKEEILEIENESEDSIEGVTEINQEPSIIAVCEEEGGTHAKDQLCELQTTKDTPMIFRVRPSNAGVFAFDLGCTGNIIKEEILEIENETEDIIDGVTELHQETSISAFCNEEVEIQHEELACYNGIMDHGRIKRKALSLEEKLNVIRFVESNTTLTRAEVAKQLNMGTSTVNGIMAQKATLNSRLGYVSCKIKRKRTGKYEDVESKLLVWFKQSTTANKPINGTLLREKAVEIAERLGVDFIPSNGWIDRFKKRYGLIYKVIRGQSRSVNIVEVEEWKTKQLYPILEQYRPCDVFSADELGLFYRLLPNETSLFKGENCQGGKMSKERITVLVGANMDGSDKLPLIVIGKSEKPCCFKNTKTLPCKYRNDKAAWMTCGIFEEFLKILNAKMGGSNRKIVLFVDNCPAHPKNTEHLSNVRVEFLPASVVHPMDQGVIKVLKTHFRKRFVHRLLQHFRTNTNTSANTNFKLSVLDAMHFLAASWDIVSSSVIIRCFKKAGFYGQDSIECKIDCDKEEKEIGVSGWDFLQKKLNFRVRFKDYVDVDNDIILCELQSIEDICNENNLSESEEEEEEFEVPIYTEAVNALSTFQKFIHSISDVPESVLKCIRELDSFSMKLSPQDKFMQSAKL